MSSGNFQKAFLNNFTIFNNLKKEQDNPSSFGTNITQNPSIKFGSITPSKNGQMDSPSNTLALSQTVFGHQNNFSFQN